MHTYSHMRVLTQANKMKPSSVKESLINRDLLNTPKFLFRQRKDIYIPLTPITTFLSLSRTYIWACSHARTGFSVLRFVSPAFRFLCLDQYWLYISVFRFLWLNVRGLHTSVLHFLCLYIYWLHALILFPIRTFTWDIEDTLSWQK